MVITVYKDKSFTFITKQPPASNLLKKVVNTNLPGEVEFVTIGRKAAQGLSRLQRASPPLHRSRIVPKERTNLVLN